MNREIKFRGKRIDNCEWVYGNIYFEDDLNCIIVDHFKTNIKVKTETVGQYIGLNDQTMRKFTKEI